MPERDYYEILGINRDADAGGIKKVYRDLVRKFHPDINQDDPDATERMKELNEAYAVLSDPEKRRLYDLYGHQGLQGYTTEDIFRGVDFSNLFQDFGRGEPFGFGDSFLGGLFGRGASRQKGPRKGADLRYDLSVTLEEAVFGAEKIIHLPRIEECPVCKGTGAEPGGLEDCKECHGTGQIIAEQRRGSSVFRQIHNCPQCHGTGKIITKPCEECKGQGFLEKTRDITVTIPPGADTDHRIRVEGEGEKGKDLPGDLYVVLDVKRHPMFERHGDNLYLQKEIPFTTATLGGRIKVVNLEDNPLSLDIPEGTQTGTVFRIDGQGIIHLKGQGKGDEYVVVKVTTPVNLTERQKELLREFERLENNKEAANDSHNESNL